MDAEMELAKALASVPSTEQEKLAAHFETMSIEELEDFLRKEGIGTRADKTASAHLDLSPEEKLKMADSWGRELAKEAKKNKKGEITKLSGPFGSMVSSLAPTITKGMQSAKSGLGMAGKALKGTSMAGRAIGGGVAGAVGGAVGGGGVDPMTGQPKGRIMGALKGGVAGAALGAGAPKLVAGGQKMLGKGIKAVGSM